MTKSKGEFQSVIRNDLLSIYNRRVELTKSLSQNLEDNLAYLRELAAQLSQPSSGPLVARTPKIRKRIPRIETIPEDEIFEQEEQRRSTSSLRSVAQEKEQEVSQVGRSKRSASKKAADNIKKQASFTLIEKLRRPSNNEESDSTSAKRIKRDTQTKRKMSLNSSSDEDDIRSDPKYSKVGETPEKAKRSTMKIAKKTSEEVAQPIVLIEKIEKIKKSKEKNTPKDTAKSTKSRHSDSSRSKHSQDKIVSKIDDMIIAPNTDTVDETMYEDAIEKPTPIMNSTMKQSDPAVIGKALNVTVVLERLSQKKMKLNETVVIEKPNIRNNIESKKTNTEKASQNSKQLSKEMMQCNNYDELITEDESSPEIKRPKRQPAKKKETRRISSSEDEVSNTPVKTRHRGVTALAQETKTTYKSNALFSPYAKESVKKRVEAFEQVVMYSPKAIDADAPVRVTRTKTRAMAAAEAFAETNTEKNIAQVLARKSLAKAKKLSLVKKLKDNLTEDSKENKDTLAMPERINKLLLNDKPSAKSAQLTKTTPLNKIRMMQPPVNRLQTPTNNQNLANYQKTLTDKRINNIVIGVESFITKSVSKTNLAETEDKKDKRPEEDARKKREEALRLMTEEKRKKRQEKELKNKLAREAKEKYELEKRQKTEKEREEKAKLALLIAEKQREEMEKKRLAQLQRAQEKEERRKLEEQQRLQKLQEQEETERLLAEQRRREQEAEKRREAELRAQQQAAAEALRQKHLMLATQAKNKQQLNKHQGATNYKLDSEPDDDESDDESKPKHEIPHWALPQNRKVQLAMQQHVPEKLICKVFGTRECTPKLTEMFPGIDKKRLKRTSSAIWKTPPRISMMEAVMEEP